MNTGKATIISQEHVQGILKPGVRLEDVPDELKGFSETDAGINLFLKTHGRERKQVVLRL